MDPLIWDSYFINNHIEPVEKAQVCVIDYYYSEWIDPKTVPLIFAIFCYPHQTI